MYLWALHSADTSVPPAVRGVTDDLDRAMRVTEPYLIEERAFLCRIVQVRYAMTVTSMDTCYVPTGRAWNGGRNDHGGVTWQETETEPELRSEIQRNARCFRGIQNARGDAAQHFPDLKIQHRVSR
jgi:hypothetical protein